MTWLRRRGFIATLAAAGVALGACGGAATTGAGSPRSAPDGAVTLLDGGQTTLSALRGDNAALVWFVAGGCASCAASIPAVAARLTSFARSHTKVIALGLYGAFGADAGARTQLVDFARPAAGAGFSDPGWTWAMASAALSVAYDPNGTPDEYFLLSPTGAITYRGSVPVTTMAALLSHLGEATGGHKTSSTATAKGGVLP